MAASVEGGTGMDPLVFRRVMGRFATGVTVVTGLDSDGDPFGFTANSLSSVSLHPPLVSVCVDRRADSHDPLIDSGAFADEIVPVEIKGRKGQVTVVDTDEPPRRDTSMEAMARLKPAFAGDAPPEVTDPSVTAGNAPGLNDGAAATVVTSESYATANGLDILGRVAAYSVGATAPRDLFFAPIAAVRNLLDIEGTSIDDYGLFEVNEAFAVQALADARELGMDMDRINVRGGAIALGHPIGASGAKILTTLLYAMRDLDVDKGMATLCLGGGNAVALSVERA